MTWTISPPTENCGSSSEPEIGRLRSISPRLFLSSAIARLTGSFVASGLSTGLPKVELVDEDVVFGAQLAVFQLVGDIERELALLDVVAGVLARIRRKRDKIDALDFGLEVEEGLRRQRVEPGHHRHRRRVGIGAAQFHVGHAVGRGRQAADATAHLGHIDRVVRLHEEVGEVDRATLQGHLGDPDRWRCRFVRRRATRHLGGGLGGLAGIAGRRLARLRFRLPLDDVLQVEAPLLAQDQARVEVGQRDLADIDRHRLQRGNRCRRNAVIATSGNRRCSPCRPQSGHPASANPCSPR